jgi:hypothetical protein
MKRHLGQCQSDSRTATRQLRNLVRAWLVPDNNEKVAFFTLQRNDDHTKVAMSLIREPLVHAALRSNDHYTNALAFAM